MTFRYEVTAIVEDNQENTMKIVTAVNNSMDAIDAVVQEIVVQRNVSRDSVFETWALLFLFIQANLTE